MKNSLVSVIIPVYNVEKYLDKCIASIVEQTYENLEIILVDDGSEDSSPLICEEWKGRDSRIVVIHQENQGQSGARNKALDICNGDYIVFIDSDDYVQRNYVEYLFNLAVDNEAEIAICEYYFITETGVLLNRVSNSGEVITFGQKQALTELCNDELFSSSPCSKIFSKKLFDNVRFPLGRIFEDLGTTYKLFLQATSIAYGKSALYYYLKRVNSTMTTEFSCKRMDAVYFAEKMYRAICLSWPELSKIAAKRLFKEYISTMLSIVSLGKGFSEYKCEFDSIYQSLKDIRRKIVGQELSVRLKGYYLLSYLGKGVLFFVMLLEEFVYRKLKLSF